MEIMLNMDYFIWSLTIYFIMMLARKENEARLIVFVIFSLYKGLFGVFEWVLFERTFEIWRKACLIDLMFDVAQSFQINQLVDNLWIFVLVELTFDVLDFLLSFVL